MLGVCYYPEHWPEDLWAQDAEEMKSLGLDYVRIGEFAWSRIEPARNEFDFEWLDRAIEILANAGLKIVFGTPTATPPKWLIDELPDILPASLDGDHVRGFGSRRHYDFSSENYLKEALRITEVLAKRYGGHKSIVGWQTDNELCCHDTAMSGSKNALRAFRDWCKKRYESIEKLNTAWGNVFWSMEYPSFDAIELPFGAVTETNPAHSLAFRRFSSDQVVAWHDTMVKAIRAHAPGKWITHNFIPKEDLYVDAYALGADLDIASYDNYPLGRADLWFADAPADTMQRYMRTGHPDFASFYHDTTRSFAGGRYWVMEQQPGPVNWAPHNPRPAPGMVRFWSLEAFAQGAECVSYFRWRQAPFAQEQMHAGLKRPDNSKATAWAEVEQVRREIDALNVASSEKSKSRIAMVTDVEALWLSDIEQQGAGYDFRRVEFAYYCALRELGMDIDFVSADAGFSDYDLVIVPCLPSLSTDFISRCKSSGAKFVFGPRTGAKTPEFSVPASLPPGALQTELGVKVLSVETLRPDCPSTLSWQGKQYEATRWCEELEVVEGTEVVATYGDGSPAIVSNDQFIYMGTLTDDLFLRDFMRVLCTDLGLQPVDMSTDMRIVRRGGLTFAFNYSAEAQPAPAPNNAVFVLGQRNVGPRDVSAWKN
ncbi:MAG: beta-galactosidase [Kordiimonadaceae bacterium]|nr:beta-galactosidase [Kordiimonadaceae bacterium]MBO6569848.1 beta-galactosidase [Kordiimonadaceae bacterium]MBO6966056.1 beta-galactosidase [Kordiimonadaceae bacterium]